MYRKLKNFMTKVAEYFDTDTRYLRHYHYRQYMEECCHVEFYAYPMPSKLSAKITLDDNGAVVLYNTHVFSQGRQNYSICHEIGHFVLGHHANGSQSFASMVDTGNYRPCDVKIEQEANYAASLFMANHDALQFAITEQLTFDDMLIEFEMSSQALEIAIERFLIKRYYFKSYKAKEIVTQFKNDELDLYELLSEIDI